MTAKKKGYAQRNFRDAGTEQSFKAGDPVDIDAGSFANYEAAGLVGAKKPTAKADDSAETPAA